MSNSKYQDMGTALGRLTQEKNEAYGDSFRRSGEIMAILYPDGIKPEQYRDALGVVRVVDKLFRIATRKDAFGESPWKDIAGYGIIGSVGDRVHDLPADFAEEFSKDDWEPKPGDKVRVENTRELGTVVSFSERFQVAEVLLHDAKKTESFGVELLEPAP